MILKRAAVLLVLAAALVAGCAAPSGPQRHGVALAIGNGPERHRAAPAPDNGQQRHRVALVIGNGNYQGAIPKLSNPPNDAAALASMTRRLGYDTLLLLDANHDEMQAAIRAFREAAAGADLAIIFYSGHAVEINGRNMLLPVDFVAGQSPGSFLQNALPLADLDASLAGRSGPALIFLDACRSDPLAEDAGQHAGDQSRGAQATTPEQLPKSGLLAERAQYASAMVYATEPGDVAYDGAGSYSPFTSALLQNFPTNAINLEQFLSLVKLSVADSTDGAQVPTWEARSIPAMSLFDSSRSDGVRLPIPRMPTRSRPAASSGSVSGPGGAALHAFNGVPLVFDPPTLAANFYCSTGYRRVSQHDVSGFIIVNQDGVACGMQKYATLTPHVPAIITLEEEPHHGRVIIKDNTFAYVPAEGFVGGDTFTVTWEFPVPGTHGRHHGHHHAERIGHRLVEISVTVR
ncbi:MAG TPA: caspase family protein [Acetobacteraceae bacterium]|nr:caspase family protein [Acetobacteraceae bacterium]